MEEHHTFALNYSFIKDCTTMKTRILTLLIALLAMATGARAADEIKSLTLYIAHNNKPAFKVEVPASGFDEVNLSEEQTTSLIISKVEVETSGSVSDIAFWGSMYSVKDGGASADEWRGLSLANQGDGKWALEFDGGVELIEEDWIGANKTKTFEFYVKGKNSSGNNIFYNNVGANYKVTFTTGEGSDTNWKVKFYKAETATLDLRVDGTPQSYTYNGDAARTPGPDQQPGEVKSLIIDGFSVWFIHNDGVGIDNVSLQYKVYEEGQEGGWNRLDAAFISAEDIKNIEKNRIDHKMTYAASKLNCDITESLKPGKNYVLEIAYQVVTTDNDYFFEGKGTESSLFKFSLSNDAHVKDVTTEENAEGTRYTLGGQPASKDYKGIVVEKEKKYIVK